MKRKIIALVLAAVMVFSTVPAFAADNAKTYKITKNVIGTAENPLTVSYGLDGLQYLNLGDSVAAAYGLPPLDTIAKVHDYVNINKDTRLFNLFGKKRLGEVDVPGSYFDLIQKYFKCRKNDAISGAVCGLRMEDICTLLDPVKYPGDLYYYAVMYSATQNIDEIEEKVGVDEGTMPTETLLTYAAGIAGEGKEDYIPEYEDCLDILKDLANKVSLDEKVTAMYTEAVKKADFITIAAGGNNFATYPLSMYAVKAEGADFSGRSLSDYFGKTAADAFYSMKAKSGDNSNLFDLLEIYLCSIAEYVEGVGDVLDLIHKINPDAVVAVIGIPDAYANYDIDTGKALIVDLDKIVRPLYAVVNTAIRNAAEARSSYVRYIDISGVDLIKAPYDKEIFKKQGVIKPGKFKDLMNGHIEITHASYLGHSQVADRIMANFEFRALGGKISKATNFVNNLETMAKSRIGITKITNLIEAIKRIDIISGLKIDFAGLLVSLFENK